MKSIFLIVCTDLWQIQDIKALLGDKTDEERREVPQSTLVDLLSLGRAHSQSSLEQLLPNSQEDRDTLLDVYWTNVEPLLRIMHKPTIVRKFSYYNCEAHPISFAIYFAAINSLSSNVVLEKFGESKETLLDRYQLGVEITLARENYLTTSSLEIFQGFILWLTCITREEDIGEYTQFFRIRVVPTDCRARESLGVARAGIPDRLEFGSTS